MNSTDFRNPSTRFWCIDQQDKGMKGPITQLAKFDNVKEARAAFDKMKPIPGKTIFLGRYVGTKLQQTLDHK